MDQATKYSNIPQELRNSARWVLWRLEDTEIDGKLRKRSKSPKQAQHPERNAQNNNPDHWCSLEAALAAEASLTASPEYKNEPNNKGIGLIIGPPYVAVDIDKVRDP
jgi:primase-polymerase (primpol)-like protein